MGFFGGSEEPAKKNYDEEIGGFNTGSTMASAPPPQMSMGAPAGYGQMGE